MQKTDLKQLSSWMGQICHRLEPAHRQQIAVRARAQDRQIVKKTIGKDGRARVSLAKKIV